MADHMVFKEMAEQRAETVNTCLEECKQDDINDVYLFV